MTQKNTPPLELLTPDDMGLADLLTIAGGTPGAVLMENAGAAVALAALNALNAGTKRVTLFCGPGNNGGDGFVAARLLLEQGCAVRLGLLGDPAALKGDALNAAKLWTGPIIPLADLSLDSTDVVIDAMFGAGLARDLDGIAADAVRRINDWHAASGGPVIAVDVPSGIDGASGQVRGVAVQATHTVTFFRAKPGHVLLPGRLHCGQIILADIGIAPDVLPKIGSTICLNQPRLWRDTLPVPGTRGHKYARGHALVVSGGMPRTGAARLAARAALRVGAGLVTIASPSDALNVHATALDAVMVERADGGSGLAKALKDRRRNAVLMGPGLGVGDSSATLVRVALDPDNGSGRDRSFVFDADALTAFSGNPVSFFQAIRTSGAEVVITPHDGEFARLFSGLRYNLESNSQELESFSETLESEAQSLESLLNGVESNSKLQRARDSSSLANAVVILKGADTIVAAPDGRAAISYDGPPWLATAGSGDVLAGILTGLLAQGMPMFEAACAAVWMHGAAAKIFGPGLIAEDLPETLPKVLAGLYPPLDDLFV